MRFVLCVLCVVSGCSKPVEERPESVHIEAPPVVVPTKQVNEPAKRPSSSSLSNSLARTAASLDASLNEMHKNDIARRSCCEGSVKEAIAVIDQYIDRDPAAKQIVQDNADWYERYRNCESMCFIPTGEKKIADFARDQFREKSADEETAILHAFLDFTEQYRKTDVDYSSSIKERSTVNQPGASDNYKSTYLKASEFIFGLATNPETDKHAALGLKADDLEKVSKMRPMFPQGSRLKNTESDSKRLFGE